MSTHTHMTATTIRSSIGVDAPIDRAFRVFTEDFGAFKPASHNLLGVEIAETDNRTRVELEHRNLDRHGNGWEGLREGVGGHEGWPLYLQRYADVIAKES
jgi:hypothetical protein